MQGVRINNGLVVFTTNYPTYPFQNEPMCEALGGLDSAVMDLWIIRMVQSGLCFEAIDTRKEAVNQRVGGFPVHIVREGRATSD